MAPDGSGQTQIPNSEDGDIHPAFSPDGSKIAFFRAMCCTGVDLDLGYMGVDGSGRVQLTDTTPEAEYDPNWSGDAQQLAFVSREDSSDTEAQIQVFDLATGGRTPLTSNEFDDVDPSWQVIREGIEDPAWSQSTDPANTPLAYISGGDIYTVSADLTGAFATFGSPELVYDTDGFDANSPTWNQNGTAIAFVQGNPDTCQSQPPRPRVRWCTQLTSSSNGISNPSWSRTAGDDRIAYQQQLETGNQQIYAIDTSTDPSRRS